VFDPDERTHAPFARRQPQKEFSSMVSYCFSSRGLLNRIAIAASAFALFALPYAAQAQTESAPEGGQQYSSSSGWKSYLTDYDFDGAPGASASPQYGQSNRYPDYTSRWSHLAFEAGAGFTAPVGNDTHPYESPGFNVPETWGYNIIVGGGWNFTKRLGALLEFQFDKQKIPGSALTTIYDEATAEGISLSGPLGGNVNTWSFTVDPIFYQPFSKSFGGYVTGGGGFYRKVTNFSEPELEEECYFYCVEGYQYETVSHSSSNQGGLNFGVGFYWKAFGEDSNAKLYAETRYIWVDSPVSSNSDPWGGGTEGLVPVTLGIRY
jgi:hypothetical protein